MSHAWDEIVGAEPEEERLWELFHENSKTHRLSDVPDDEEVAVVMLDLWEDLPYAGRDVVRLPGLAVPPLPLETAILERRTDTRFGPDPISLSDLSSLLTGGSAAVILITAVFQRTTFKYGERGYRFALIEAGHVAQNIDLVAGALHLPAANLGGFFDRELEALLDIDGVEQSLVYAVALGSNPDP